MAAPLLATKLVGLRLLGLGIVVFQAGLLPRFLGVLVMLAGAGYAVDSFGCSRLPRTA